uniref:Uncharacterized protein n=1 Tax=Arundo donax TaxID=35708 RepID=A0A0A9AID0_ARUDO
MLMPLLFHLWHSISTKSFTTGSVESSNTCITSRSDGHSSSHAAPIDSLYTSLSLYMGICTSTIGCVAPAPASASPAAAMGSHRYRRSGFSRNTLTARHTAQTKSFSTSIITVIASDRNTSSRTAGTTRSPLKRAHTHPHCAAVAAQSTRTGRSAHSRAISSPMMPPDVAAATASIPRARGRYGHGRPAGRGLDLGQRAS